MPLLIQIKPKLFTHPPPKILEKNVSTNLHSNHTNRFNGNHIFYNVPNQVARKGNPKPINSKF